MFACLAWFAVENLFAVHLNSRQNVCVLCVLLRRMVLRRADAEKIHAARQVGVKSVICSGGGEVAGQHIPRGEIGGNLHAIGQAGDAFPLQGRVLIGHGK